MAIMPDSERALVGVRRAAVDEQSEEDDHGAHREAATADDQRAEAAQDLDHEVAAAGEPDQPPGAESSDQEDHAPDLVGPDGVMEGGDQHGAQYRSLSTDGQQGANSA